MGGLVTEIQTNLVDKIPYLGNIPLLGKLFQSKTSKKVNRNLLIFVTARIVNMSGNPVRYPGHKGD